MRLAWVLPLAVAAGCASTGGPPPVPPTPTPGPTAVVPTPTAIPAPPGPAPSGVAGAAVGVPIRVLLDRSSAVTTLPQPGRAYLAAAGDEEAWIWGPLEIAAIGDTVWQVGAWSSPEAAATVARKLVGSLGEGVRVSQETTGAGLVRVRVAWPDGEPADPRAQLAEAGFDDAFRVSGAGTVRITGAAGVFESASEIVLTPAGEWPTAVGDRRYRGRFRIRSGGDEVLLINELPMEAYLRGVVPVEMGPYQFPELEALKAQAVAARTYAVAHLGDHDEEGWDICATPACQVYGGAGAEHALSDRAVKETAGRVAVFAGVPIDAMYTSTCGGRTEDAAELFSGRGQPYLTGVECAWERPILLSGKWSTASIGDGGAFRRLLAREALGLSDEETSPAALLPAVASLCGGESRPLPTAPDLTEWAEALLAAAGLSSSSPLVDGVGSTRLVELADLFDIPLPPTTPDDWTTGWTLEAVAAVLEIQEVIQVDRGEVVPHPDGAAIYPRRADASEALPQPLPLVWRWGSSYGSAAALRVLPGTTVERVRVGDRIIALAVVESGGGGEADRRSAWRSWRRERSWDELAARLGEPELDRLEIVRRGHSGRVVELAVVDRRGGRRLVEGFDVRRVLDLPETLFDMQVRTLADGRRTVRFLGRGWGHGVGLCQNGAYGLARAGMTYDAILKHYYTGIDIVEWGPE
jgi:stage II sporulation protein D